MGRDAKILLLGEHYLLWGGHYSLVNNGHRWGVVNSV